MSLCNNALERASHYKDSIQIPVLQPNAIYLIPMEKLVLLTL